MIDYDATPPANIEAEMGVIGSMLINPKVLPMIEHIIKQDDFYGDANGKLYSHIVAMYEAGGGVDITTLVDRLRDAGIYEEIGGPAFLAHVGRSVANAAHAVHYARIVHEKAQKRRVANVIVDAHSMILRSDNDALTTIDKLHGQLQEIATRTVSNSTIEAGDASEKAIAKIISDSSIARTPGIRIGFPEFNRRIGGFFRGELNTLAARPGGGKTSLGLQIGVDVAERGERVLFCSLEMSAVELMTRHLAGAAGVNHARIRSGNLSKHDLEKLSNAAEAIKPAALTIDDATYQSVASIRAAAQRAKHREEPSLIIIDYLGCIQPTDTRLKRHEQVGQIIVDLKQLARDMNVPVLVLCQLRRDVEKNAADHVPKLSDLKESGRIEEESDVVLFIHRKGKYRPDDVDLAGQAELIVAKNRNGPEATFPLNWDAARTRYSEPVETDEDDLFPAEFANPSP